MLVVNYTLVFCVLEPDYMQMFSLLIPLET